MNLIDVLNEINEFGGGTGIKGWLREFVKAYKLVQPSTKNALPADILRYVGKNKILRMYRRGIDPTRAAKIFAVKLKG